MCANLSSLNYPALRFRTAFFATILLSSCASHRKAVKPKHESLPGFEVSARNNPMDIYRATTTKVWDIPHSSVELHFDFIKRTASCKAMLQIKPYLSAPDTMVLDAKGMHIKQVAILREGRPGMDLLPFSYDSLQLKIEVRNQDFGTITTPKIRQIFIEYTAMPYASEAGGSAAISEDRGLYFINTNHETPEKPVQIWTQGETESNSHWLPTIDKPNQRTTTDITLIVPDTMQTLSNGKLISSTPESPGFRRDHWAMDKPIQVYAIMFAIGRFDIAKEQYKDENGGLHDVNYYTEPAYASTAKGMFKGTPEMIEFFSKTTGIPYPWDTYSQVVVRDYVSGAMENSSASLFGEFVNQNERQLLDNASEDVVSHELFHQWFGDYVTAESWSNLTLNESFATFGEYLWRRHKYGQAYADELAHQDLDRYLLAAEKNDPPLVRFHYADKEAMFDRISYQKGGTILRYINSIAGDTLFYRAMKNYLSKNALQPAEATQWRLALEEATGQDWTQFFNQWYYRAGHPQLKVTYHFDDVAGKVRVDVRQISSPDSSFNYVLPLKTAILFGPNDAQLVDWTIASKYTSFAYKYKNNQRPLIIPDAGHFLPGIIAEDKPLDDWLKQVKWSDNYISKIESIDAAIRAEAQPMSIEIVAAGMEDKLAEVRAYAFSQATRITRESWKAQLAPKISYALQTETNNKARAAALSLAGIWKQTKDENQILKAVSDRSYLVSGAALSAMQQIDLERAYALAESLRNTDPKNALLYAVWGAIVTKGNPEDMAQFEEMAPTFYGGTKVAFANILDDYAKAVTDKAIFENALNLLLKMAKDESIKTYRFSIGSNLITLQQHYQQLVDEKKDKSGEAALRLTMVKRSTLALLAAEKDLDNVRKWKVMGR